MLYNMQKCVQFRFASFAICSKDFSRTLQKIMFLIADFLGLQLFVPKFSAALLPATPLSAATKLFIRMRAFCIILVLYYFFDFLMVP